MAKKQTNKKKHKKLILKAAREKNDYLQRSHNKTDSWTVLHL